MATEFDSIDFSPIKLTFPLLIKGWIDNDYLEVSQDCMLYTLAKLFRENLAKQTNNTYIAQDVGVIKMLVIGPSGNEKYAIHKMIHGFNPIIKFNNIRIGDDDNQYIRIGFTYPKPYGKDNYRIMGPIICEQIFMNKGGWFASAEKVKKFVNIENIIKNALLTSFITLMYSTLNLKAPFDKNEDRLSGRLIFTKWIDANNCLLSNDSVVSHFTNKFRQIMLEKGYNAGNDNIHFTIKGDYTKEKQKFAEKVNGMNMKIKHGEVYIKKNYISINVSNIDDEFTTCQIYICTSVTKINKDSESKEMDDFDTIIELLHNTILETFSALYEDNRSNLCRSICDINFKINQPTIPDLLPFSIITEITKKEETKDIKENDYKCVVCLTNNKSVLIEPCCHLCLCNNCSSKVIDVCPICRKKIGSKISVYY